MPVAPSNACSRCKMYGGDDMDDEMIDMRGRLCLALDQIEECREFASLIPEVRSNLVYAKKGARTRDDVLAVDGRITVVQGMPRAAGKPRFGASSHMARLLIEFAEGRSLGEGRHRFRKHPAPCGMAGRVPAVNGTGSFPLLTVGVNRTRSKRLRALRCPGR